MVRSTRKRSWTVEQLKKAVTSSGSYRQVLSKLGLREAGGNYAQIRKYTAEYDLDISHFHGKLWSKGKKLPFKPKIQLEELLRKGVIFPSYKLKRRLFQAGLKSEKCEECGWNQKAVEGYSPVELDHINGDVSDNRIENLRILCPNCHSLQPTHRGKNKRGKKQFI